MTLTPPTLYVGLSVLGTKNTSIVPPSPLDTSARKGSPVKDPPIEQGWVQVTVTVIPFTPKIEGAFYTEKSGFYVRQGLNPTKLNVKKSNTTFSLFVTHLRNETHEYVGK